MDLQALPALQHVDVNVEIHRRNDSECQLTAALGTVLLL